MSYEIHHNPSGFSIYSTISMGVVARGMKTPEAVARWFRKTALMEARSHLAQNGTQFKGADGKIHTTVAVIAEDPSDPGHPGGLSSFGTGFGHEERYKGVKTFTAEEYADEIYNIRLKQAREELEDAKRWERS